MGNSILSKYNCDTDLGGNYYCSNCLKSLDNGEETGSMPPKSSSTSKDETQETAKCTSSSNKRKSHLNCLLECFERGDAKKCSHCQQDIADDPIFSRFLKRITRRKSEGTVDLHAYDVPTEEEFERQTLSKNIRDLRVGVIFGFSEVFIYRVILKKPSDVEESLELTIYYIKKLQECLKSVPEHLHKTKEYKEGAQLYKDAMDEYIDTLKWLSNPFF